ncbi:MAG TPA: 23S rRNA pseudouridylate synthase B, partial [Gammaproteobacteria bacterium]|nr:23S rRNA pseudouridylate synthase B [Gammaproteobacteria bacterium]
MRKPEAPNPPEPEKLQKIIAASGIASRREAETWIDAGRVSVNGETAHLGQRAARTDQIEVDGRRVVTRSKQPP